MAYLRGVLSLLSVKAAAIQFQIALDRMKGIDSVFETRLATALFESGDAA